ncbi:MAG: RNA polymerase sigma factor [Actinomycetota bacterium]|nr:RNA polymerase sigma factor [Actinomycetota bacterium]
MDAMDGNRLVQLMRTGDPSGFDAVYERYAKALFRTAFLICGDTGDAEDAVQETFVICFTSISQLRHEESLRFWLYRILTRAARDISRRHARETADEHIAERVDEELCRDGSMTAIEAYDDHEAFEQWLEHLSPVQREVVVLRYHDDMSIADIAQMLDCREGTVKSRLHAARRKLRKAVERGEEQGYAYQRG